MQKAPEAQEKELQNNEVETAKQLEPSNKQPPKADVEKKKRRRRRPKEQAKPKVPSETEPVSSLAKEETPATEPLPAAKEETLKQAEKTAAEEPVVAATSPAKELAPPQHKHKKPPAQDSSPQDSSSEAQKVKERDKERLMLISTEEDERTHVAIIDNNNRLLEYSLEVGYNKPIRGNIYLATVTRVESSLQAAFINFGGEKNGFLPFAEIRPNYYQLPQEAREAILKQISEKGSRVEETTDIEPQAVVRLQKDETGELLATDSQYLDGKTVEENLKNGIKRAVLRRDIGKSYVKLLFEVSVFEDDEEALTPQDEKTSRLKFLSQHKYRINEVIKSGQVMLVQVVREPRGEKGATLTTNISLPGRYSILMPHYNRGICVSRKIWPMSERARLKMLVSKMGLPEGVGFILRTAANGQKMQELKRDCKRQLKLWEEIGESTLESNAPKLIYEEGNQIRRAIRDLYNENIVKIIVDTQKTFREFRKMMQDMISGGTKRVVYYKEKTPLFNAYPVQKQITELYQKRVTLKSGGTLVIQPTEALVSIDVNSGKSTQESNIEETALKTNLEAAEEVARQIGLRNLAGIIVIDFIDMKPASNNRKVEMRLKEAFAKDRAKIQFGTIDNFGVMMISRQRVFFSKQEISTLECPVCSGNGYTFSPEFGSWLALRALEEYLLQKSENQAEVDLHVPLSIALQILNGKRTLLTNLEQRYHTKLVLKIDDSLHHPNCYRIGDQAVSTDQPDPKPRKIRIRKRPSDTRPNLRPVHPAAKVVNEVAIQPQAEASDQKVNSMPVTEQPGSVPALQPVATQVVETSQQAAEIETVQKTEKAMKPKSKRVPRRRMQRVKKDQTSSTPEKESSNLAGTEKPKTEVSIATDTVDTRTAIQIRNQEIAAAKAKLDKAKAQAETTNSVTSPVLPPTGKPSVNSADSQPAEKPVRRKPRRRRKTSEISGEKTVPKETEKQN